MRSIRTFLIVNLLLSTTLVTSLAIIGNLFLAHRDFQTHLDAQLTLAAYTIQAFLDEESDQQDLLRIQEKINKLPRRLNQQMYDTHGEISGVGTLFKSVQFQVWNRQGKLILHSFGAPDIDERQEVNGFIDLRPNDDTWRVYSIYNPQSGIRIVVLQRYDFRIDLERQITHDSIMIMLFTYPFLGLLIWVIVGRGLHVIKRTARSLSKRDHKRLKPLTKQYVPQEILPLVEAINGLFNRLKHTFIREQRFASDVAHELRTPLAAAHTHAQVAMQADSPAQSEQAIAKIIKSVDRAAHVVQQLLTLSRTVPQALQQEMQPVMLAQLAQEMIADLTPSAIERDIELALIAGDGLKAIQGNAIILSIMLRNMIDNAIRYSPDGSVVEVHIDQFNKRQVLKVIDNGPGIPEEVRDKVFERFYRVDGTQASGSGLGLSIIDQIVDLHNASIKLETAPSGRGLAIIVSFISMQ